ncbi:hypothetical protein CYLTODRAFT_427088 [Cylindrobasidium torrendii FP15055 ss-10]|uniref:RFX-type winged-helix domain-containing protein n=1 Tax=Cylindrobasidium torrendii FP15055 ss-10 TaxID=1314674 RepID=A0A0D7AVH1_9AGAR|nr:hypothetical protein CYLTODRAFT_427088 [Cylindrobasidium torrendii FP15055 ss-10]
MDMEEAEGRFERVCAWLESNYSAQHDCEILQAEIWDNFATYSLRKCPELSLSPTEFFAYVAKAFPGAISTTTDGPMGVHIIRGIVKLPQSQWAPCTSSYCGCPNHYVPPVLREEEDNFEDDPRFVQLTRSNECPTNVQANCITALVSDLEDRMSSLDQELVHRHNLHGHEFLAIPRRGCQRIGVQWQCKFFHDGCSAQTAPPPVRQRRPQFGAPCRRSRRFKSSQLGRAEANARCRNHLVERLRFLWAGPS